VLGVTGTNGKTTTVHMTRAILAAAGIKCGMLSTVQNDLCGRTVEADMTTPGPLKLAEYVRECTAHGGRALVMEVSSHALDQKRTDALPFSAAAFTNLTQDHLDYHGSMDAYGAAKARLFERLAEDATAVVNRDDPAWERMVRDCKARVVTYGLAAPPEKRSDSVAAAHGICATITRDSIAGTLYRLKIDGHDLALENALVGRHNVYNAMAAAGLAQAIGVELGAIEAGLNGLRNVPGRLQRVPCVSGVDVFVDYAHTDDAIHNVAAVLRPLTRKRLIVVFGCGGDRDRTKRPKMARAAAEFAHAIIVTSDNPRTEEPRAIVDEVLTGFDDAARRRVVVEIDRRRAIHMALACAAEGDVVLIAGKGHETYQIVGTERRHFDDVETAIEAAAGLGKSA
jgi:UDP-N-acetylmuramoyl-L-alanyl-D-glutamate--2,6-diaminopimelate ligase